MKSSINEQSILSARQNNSYTGNGTTFSYETHFDKGDYRTAVIDS